MFKIFQRFSKLEETVAQLQCAMYDLKNPARYQIGQQLSGIGKVTRAEIEDCDVGNHAAYYELRRIYTVFNGSRMTQIWEHDIPKSTLTA